MEQFNNVIFMISNVNVYMHPYKLLFLKIKNTNGSSHKFSLKFSYEYSLKIFSNNHHSLSLPHHIKNPYFITSKSSINFRARIFSFFIFVFSCSSFISIVYCFTVGDVMCAEV